MLVGQHVAKGIKLGNSFDQLGRGCVANKDKDAKVVAIICAVDALLAGLDIAVAQGTQRGIARRLHHLGVVEHGDLLVALRFLGGSGRAGKIILANQNGDVARVLGEKDALLRRGETAANDKDVLAGEELAVARGAVGDAVAAKLILARKTNAARAGARSEQGREAGNIALRGLHLLDIAIQIKARHFREHELGTKGLGLASHGLRELRAASGVHTGIVHHLIGNGDLASKMILLDNQHAVTRAGEIDCSGEAGRPSTDDDGIIELIDVHRLVLQRYKPGKQP